MYTPPGHDLSIILNQNVNPITRHFSAFLIEKNKTFNFFTMRELQNSNPRRLASFRSLPGVLLMLLVMLLVPLTSNAFATEPRRLVRTGGTPGGTCALSSTLLQSTETENVKAALKRPRGASIGAEFTPSTDLVCVSARGMKKG